MDRKKLLARIVILMILLFIFDRLASKFYWYFTVWWFDMPMHFFGGIWVGLFFLYAYKVKNISLRSVIEVTLSVLVMGILWEIFEFYVFNGIGRYPFDLLDTFSDIFFDLAGGLTAVWYVSRRIMPVTENTVQLTNVKDR